MIQTQFDVIYNYKLPVDEILTPGSELRAEYDSHIARHTKKPL